MSIVSFYDKKNKNFWEGKVVIEWKSFESSARKKLDKLNQAKTLFDLSNKGNRLHALREERKGQYNISIDKKWRICFIWEKGNAYEVEIIDYH